MTFISPSSFSSFKKCLAKPYLNKYGGNKTNRSASGYFGSFCHMFINKASKYFHKKKPNKVELKKLWEQELEKYSLISLKKDPRFRFKYPLKTFVKDFIYIRTFIINNLEKRLRREIVYEEGRATSEYSIFVDGFKASIDLVYKNQKYVKLVDFKFGKIFDENNHIKDHYQKQLYIYSAMYYLKYNVKPSSLVISNNKFIEFELDHKNMEYCINLFEEMKILNNRVANINSIFDLKSISKPTIENCKYCIFRVDCPSYWESGISESEENIDLLGSVVEVKNFSDGMTVILKINENKIEKIYDVPVMLKNIISKGIKIAFLNLYKKNELTNNNYLFSKYSDFVFLK